MNGYESYLSGSVLPKYEYVPAKEPVRKERVEKEISRAQSNKLFYKVFMIGLFAAVFTIVLRYTIITQMNNQVADLNKQLVMAEKGAQQAAVHMEELTDLNAVKEYAQTELGMNTPQPHQIIEIDVPLQNKTVAMTQTKAEEGNFFKNLWDYCMEYLY